MNDRIKKKQEDKYLRTTANEILSHWLDDLLKNNSTDSFYKIPVNVIEKEIISLDKFIISLCVSFLLSMCK